MYMNEILIHKKSYIQMNKTLKSEIFPIFKKKIEKTS